MNERKLTLDSSDKSREGVTVAKILQLPQMLFVPRASHAIAKVEKFADIDLKAISAQIGREIKAVILDVDDCIAPHHGEVLPENLEKIRQWISEGIRVIIFSNMQKSDRYTPLEEMGVEVHTGDYGKPDSRGFDECREKLNATKDETVTIGDNFLTDGGSIQAGISFIKVQPITGAERKKSFKRGGQVLFRKFIDGVSNFYDRLLQRKVWRPEK